MSVVDVSNFDYADTILNQYSASPSLLKLIENMNWYFDPQQLFDSFYNNIWNIETAVGYGLDVWGRIVGVGRVLTISNAQFLGLNDVSGASGYPYGVGTWYDGQNSTSNYVLDDTAYRALILTKALYNICDGSIPAINQVLMNLFGPDGVAPLVIATPGAGTGNCYCTDGENMTMTYHFNTGGGALTALQYAIIYQSGVLPKPVGVLATVVVT